MSAKIRRLLIGGALVGAIAVLGSACASSDSNGGGGGGGATTTPADLSLLGPVKKATGEPIEIGFLYSGETQAIDARPELKTAEAAVEYTNEHLGGIGGRPIKLLPCADKLTPSVAVECANEMIAAKVPVVLHSQPSDPKQVMGMLEGAGIPYFTYQGFDQSILLSPDGYAIGNPLVIVAAPVKLAQDAGNKKIAMVYIDIPATATFKSVAEPIFTQFDLDLVATAVPPGTPDVTPQVQAAMSDGADEFVVIGDSTLCINTLKALKTLGFDGTIMVNPQCLGGLAEAVPGGIDGVHVASISSTDPEDEEVALYDAVVAKYSPDTKPGTNAEPGYAVTLAFVRSALDLDPADATSEGFVKTFAAMEPQTLPLYAEGTFQCNREISTLTPAVCSNSANLETLDADGNVKESEPLDLTPYLKL